MAEYREWLHKKVEAALDRYKERWGWRPSWPDTERLWIPKDETPADEVHKPFDRRRIIMTTLFDCERTFACYTKVLADPFGIHNREHFLDWMGYANDRYARALRLETKLPVPPAPLRTDLFE